jgi:tetratricopeptide (TPR) repeat protein
MYNLLWSILAGLATALIVRTLGFGIWAGIIPGMLVFAGAYVLLARRIATKVQAIVGEAQKELSVQPANAKEQKARVEKAIKILETALVFDKQQFLIGPEIHAQIGMIKYAIKDLDGALPHFQKANPRNHMAKALEAALYYQRKDVPKMTATFEEAVKVGKKEPIVWAAYAWCLLQLKESEKALKVMARAVEQNPSDEKLKAGLTALQNDKKLKMKAYEPMWWQFGLEQPPMQMMGGRRVQFDRR